MENVNIEKFGTSDFGPSYVTSMKLRDLGWLNASQSIRTVTMKNGAVVKLLHLEGVKPDGEIVSLDLWPNRCQTTADLAAIPDKLEDSAFRFGIYKDEETGEIVVAAQPSFIGYFVNGEMKKFGGSRPKWNEMTGNSVWTNDDPVTADESSDEAAA